MECEINENENLLLQKPFGCRCDTYAPFYPPEIVTLGQLKQTCKNCDNLFQDILHKINTQSSVQYAAGNCAASCSTVSLIHLPTTY